MPRLQLVLLLVFVAGCVLAHRTCQSDEVNQEYLNSHPELAEAYRELHNRILNHTRHEASLATRAVTNLRIPVVFHIFNPPSPVAGYPTITDTIVNNEMQWFNEWYSATNQYYNTKDPLWASRIATAADFGITWELAAFDPSGNPTTGINRYTTTMATDGTCRNSFYKPAEGGVALWDPLKYFNIFLCKIDSGTAGFAFLPSSQTFAQDGCVLNALFFGDASVRGSTIAHEAGHWLGLYHTFNGPCDPGDFVDDTPAHLTSLLDVAEHCPPEQAENLFVSDCPGVGNFMTQNNMNYNTEPCLAYFSKGQVSRMRGFLTDPTSTRSGLPTSPGLARDGGCVPNCAGKQCGDNGCGGICGSCSSGVPCLDSLCIVDNEICATATTVAFTYAQPVTRNSALVQNAPHPDYSSSLGACTDTYFNPRWFKFVAEVSNQVVIETSGGIDTILGVFTGASCSALSNCVAYNDDIVFISNLNSRVSFCATAGVTYYVVAGGFSDLTSGNFGITFMYTPSAACCTPSCSGKACGNDGCGGSCGSCFSYQYCSSNFVCVGEAPTPSPSLSGPIIVCPHNLVKTIDGCFYYGSVGTPQVYIPTGGSADTYKLPRAPYRVGQTEITHYASANGYVVSCKQVLTVRTTATNCGQD